MPARRAGYRPACRLSGCRRRTAADADRARIGSGVRPTGGVPTSAGDRRGGADRGGHGAGRHGLRLAVRGRRRVRARGGVDHPRRSRGSHVESLGRYRGRRLTMSEGERPSAEEIILYDKDPTTKIATITFNRPEFLNAPTTAARLRYAELLHGANGDDDVRVVIIRWVGDDFGSGADLPEVMEGATS